MTAPTESRTGLVEAPVTTPTDSTSDLLPAELVAFVDSSALVALADAGDASHGAAVAAYHELRLAGYRMFTTNVMIIEAYDLLFAGPGPTIASEWLSRCRITFHTVDEKDMAEARALVANAGADRGLGLSDAISSAVIARYGVQDIFAVDQQVLRALE